MAKDRQKHAYIRDEEHLSFANLDHYYRALKSNDLSWEEYHVQSVLNSPAHANNLKREVFQKKLRNHVTNKLDVTTLIDGKNASLSNSARSTEAINNPMYSRISNDTVFESEFNIEPDVRLSLMYTLEEIVLVCNSDQLKVLAYFIVREKIDNLVIDNFFENTKFDELRVYILEIWDLNVSSINSLNEFIGSKNRAEIARRSLSKLLKEKFPLLAQL